MTCARRSCPALAAPGYNHCSRLCGEWAKTYNKALGRLAMREQRGLDVYPLLAQIEALDRAEQILDEYVALRIEHTSTA